MPSQKPDIRENLVRYASFVLNQRPYFRHKLRDKLVQRCQKLEFTDYTTYIEDILNELSKSGYLNDSYLAEAFVRRQLSKGYGPRIISLKLRQLRVEPEAISAAILSEATKKAQVESAKKFFSKNSKKDIRVLSNKLFQRGFSSDIIRLASGSNTPDSIEDSLFD